MDFAGAGDGRERALALLLLSMADDEFVIGFSDSEWTGIGPILEEDVAISSLAQDELGHAQALYGLLAELVADGRTPTRGPTTGRPRATSTPGCSTTRAATGRRRSPGAGCTTPPTAPGSRRSPSRRIGPLRRARREDPARGALPPDARRRRGSSGSPTRGGEPRERLVAALERDGPGRRDRARAAPRRDGTRPARDPDRAVRRDRGALARRRRRDFRRLGLAALPPTRRPGSRPDATTPTPSAPSTPSSRWSAGPRSGATW